MSTTMEESAPGSLRVHQTPFTTSWSQSFHASASFILGDPVLVLNLNMIFLISIHSSSTSSLWCNLNQVIASPTRQLISRLDTSGISKGFLYGMAPGPFIFLVLFESSQGCHKHPLLGTETLSALLVSHLVVAPVPTHIFNSSLQVIHQLPKPRQKKMTPGEMQTLKDTRGKPGHFGNRGRL